MINIRKLGRYMLTIVFGLTAEYVMAQQTCQTLMATAHIGISPRWTILGSANYGWEQGSSSSKNYSGALGLQFNVFGNIYVYVGTQCAAANYPSFGGRNEIFSLKEGVNIVGEKLFVHNIELEQRRLVFWQVENRVNCTRGSYSLAKVLKINDKWQIIPRLGVVVNGKSEVTESSFVQRAKAEIGVRRSIGKMLNTSLTYSYMYGGKLQTYIAERHNLHALTLKINIGNRKMY